ncbi:MAG: hypothetical protein LBT29_09100, partial [Flavobacteriaceae bacterium]|nr:hypothetical protein [Flavobacteriaceae bacterium]
MNKAPDEFMKTMQIIFNDFHLKFEYEIYPYKRLWNQFFLTSTVKNHKVLLLNDLPKQRATTLFNFRVIDKALNFGV